MDILLLVALVIAAVVCFLPIIMAWNFYSTRSKKVIERNRIFTGKALYKASHGKVASG